MDLPGLKETVEKYKPEKEALIKEYTSSAQIKGSSGYVDEKEKGEMALLQRRDNERLEMLTTANNHFEKHGKPHQN